MRTKFILIAVLALAVAIAAAGCGSSGGSTSGGGSASTASSTSGSEDGNKKPSGPPLSKKEFIKEAEAVCQGIPTAYNEKVAALEKEAKKQGRKPTESEKNLKAAVPADLAAIEELEGLAPPQGDEQKVEAIIKSLENAAKGLEEKPESELSGPKSPYAEWQKLTKAYGLQFCSSL